MSRAPLAQDKVMDFVLAGRAVFTLENEQTGNRFTYKVVAPVEHTTGKRNRAADVRFVSVLTGPDNESSYTYIGAIKCDTNGVFDKFMLTRNSKVTFEALSYRAFSWFWNCVSMKRALGPVKVWHEGKCGRCGKTLTVPESIESGFGPECRSVQFSTIHNKVR